MRWFALLAALLFPAAAIAGPPEAVLALRAREAVAALAGRRDPASVFNARFLAEVPPPQLAALAKRLQAESGRIVSVEDIRETGSASASFRIRFKRGTALARLTIEPGAPHRVSGFHIGVVLPLADSPQQLLADFAALPGRAGFLIAKLGDDGPIPLLASRAEEQFAIGSTFKLWVLDALAEDIAAGRRRWDDVIPLGPRSLPGGITQAWPAKAPVTVETLATLMISLSDNTATDTLIRLIGRERIAERVRATGHADPARTLPLLTTAESFALKLGPSAQRDAYAAADADGKARLLAELDPEAVLAAADPAALDGSPTAIDTIEWFASPADVAGVLDALRQRSDPRVLTILGVAPGLDTEQQRAFAYAGYKGGSESGVLNQSWLLRRPAGDWTVVTASWNDSKSSIDQGRFAQLAQRLVSLAAHDPK